MKAKAQAFDELKDVFASDDVRVAGVALIIEKIRAINTVFPDEAAFFVGALFSLFMQLDCPVSASEIFSCLDRPD